MHEILTVISKMTAAEGYIIDLEFLRLKKLKQEQ